jgi:hypothetical protein
MTETYTKRSVHGMVRKLDRDNLRLDLDEELFYMSLKSKMDAMLLQPKSGSVNKIAEYSKTSHTS